MATVSDPVNFPPTALPREWSLADVQRHVGGVPAARIRSYPPPGMATERDLLAIQAHEDRLCELVDGVLVEKTMGSYESILAATLLHWIQTYLDQNPIGIALGADGMLRILPNQIRIPDVSVVLWSRFPDRRLPLDAVFRVAPDLAVEILSEGNSPEEMDHKLQEYRRSGVRLVWYIDPRIRTAMVYTPSGPGVVIDENGVLDAADVLPGFSFPLRKLLDRFPR
jgi:Uma2 family endonuclease